MRIGPTFTAVVAITLVGAADVHSDGSGLAEQTTRSAQPRQLAQAPEPPPMAQPGAESPPSMAPAPPAGAPPNPSPGTPAMVLDDQEVSTILGKSAGDDAVSGDLHLRLGRDKHWKREFSAAERRRDAKSGAAMSDGSFPIHNARECRKVRP